MLTQDRGTLNLHWAYALVDGLAAAGAGNAVISPGSRSTPLVLACERHPAVRTWSVIDERCAAFFALGLARRDGRPAILVATSGSAPAHWLPAVIEASHANVPLILLSADRPAELQQRGANQTTEQSGYFSRHVRTYCNPGTARSGPDAMRFMVDEGIRAAHLARWPRPGPVHINVPLREPLVPSAPSHLPPPSAPVPVDVPVLQPDTAQLGRLSSRMSSKPGCIVCGPGCPDQDFAHQITALAKQLRCPVLADPLSGLRFGGHDRERIFSRYDAFLRHPGFPGPQWVLRFGAPPTSKALLEFLDRHTVAHFICDPAGQWPDPLHRVTEMIRATPQQLCTGLIQLSLQPGQSDWLELFRAAENLAAAESPLPQDTDPFEGSLVAQLVENLPADSLLFCGNSMPVRHLDSWSGSGSRPIQFIANRGISGIDGGVSTLLGLAAGSTGKAVGLLGDLAFYHDMNGLLQARGLDAVIILLNNGGGGIFEYLPQAGLEAFERFWLTPTHLDFSRVASLYDLAYARVNRMAEFAPALGNALDRSGVDLIEVTIDRRQSVARHRKYWERVRAGVDGLLKS